MATGNKRQNIGSHLKNIRGSAFRKGWISDWLDDKENKGKHYKDAVKAYIKYKTEIANRWAAPVILLLKNCEPCERYDDYTDLLKASKDNVGTVTKALTATERTTIPYEAYVNEKWEAAHTTGWMKDGDKYLTELTKPSGQTGKWINKLKTLCENFQKITDENQIVPELEKIIEHCTYTAGEPDENDKLPLYKYPEVQELYAAIAKNLRSYQKFVANEIKEDHPKQKNEAEA